VKFPSKIAFAALVRYSPRGKSAESVRSRTVKDRVKNDGYMGPYRVIEFAAQKLANALSTHRFLIRYFNESVTLVPLPRSSPLVGPDALWPADRICTAIRAKGIVADVLPCLERVQPVQRSSEAPPGQRPNPKEHYDSVLVRDHQLLIPWAITLVDDVVTRGSTFVGLVPRLEEAFPGVEVRCFALIRTVSDGDVPSIFDPVEGAITYDGRRLRRSP